MNIGAIVSCASFAVALLTTVITIGVKVGRQATQLDTLGHELMVQRQELNSQREKVDAATLKAAVAETSLAGIREDITEIKQNQRNFEQKLDRLMELVTQNAKSN